MHSAPINLPSRREFLEMVNSTDGLAAVVRGHQCVETVLNAVVVQRLPQPHALEVSRLSFALKVDLAIALGLVEAEAKAAFLGVNRIRNEFAHQPGAALGWGVLRDLRNSLCPRHRHILGDSLDETTEPIEAWRFVVAVLFTDMRLLLARMREAAVRDEVLREIVRETLLDGAGEREVWQSQVDAEVVERTRAKLACKAEGQEYSGCP